jgi:RimJ/RimL family protein N-acetyltransferase
MPHTILIDEPGAGQWIMDRCEGVFRPGMDHSFSSHDTDKDNKILGGFVLNQYLGASMSVHMAGDDKHWCNRELLWLVFDYAFNQLGCTKMLAPVQSDNYAAISQDLRAGWHLETVIRDVYAPGIHMMVLAMAKDDCPWLDYKPKTWVSNAKRKA